MELSIVFKVSSRRTSFLSVFKRAGGDSALRLELLQFSHAFERGHNRRVGGSWSAKTRRHATPSRTIVTYHRLPSNRVFACVLKSPSKSSLVSHAPRGTTARHLKMPIPGKEKSGGEWTVRVGGKNNGQPIYPFFGNRLPDFRNTDESEGEKVPSWSAFF